MNIRYRILTGTQGQPELPEVDIEAAPKIDPEADPEPAGVDGFMRDEPPRKVLECDGDGEVSEVAKMIADRRMAPHDLVDPGDGWREAREFPPLSDVCAVIDQHERKRQRWVFVGRFAVAAVTGAAIFLLWTIAR